MKSRLDFLRRVAGRFRSARFVPGLLALSNVLVVSTGFAQEETSPAVSPATPEVVARAREAFAEGIELARQGRWIDALAALERSNELRPHAVTTYNIGYCERSLGRYTRARKMLAKALLDHKNGSNELSNDLVVAATNYLTETERQIARVTVTIASKRATLRVDGRPVELVSTDGPRPLVLAGTRDVGAGEGAPDSTFDLLIDPGTHEFVISVVDHGDLASTQVFLPGSRAVIQLSGPAERNSQLAVAELGEGRRGPGQPSRTPAWIAFAVGGAGAVVGTVSGAMAFAKKSDVADACPGPTCDEQRQSGHRAADIATGAFIVAGIGATVGVAVLLATPGKRATGGAAILPERGFVRPFAGLNSVGVEGRF